MEHTFFWPWSVLVLLAFGLAFAIILHLAIAHGVYKLTGARVLDYPLAWVMGVASACSPIAMYLALGFDEFAKTADGQKLQNWLVTTARLEMGFWIIYALAVLQFVPQK